MVLMVKHKIIVYRRFELDIWGLCFTDIRSVKITRKTRWLHLIRSGSLVLKFFYRLWIRRREVWERRYQHFIYRVDLKPLRYRRHRFNARFLSLRLTRLFFLTIQERQFRRLYKIASERTGNFEENYYHLLEGRMLMILYRTLFVSNLFEALRFIKAGAILFGTRPVTTYNFYPDVGEFIFVSPVYRNRLRCYLAIRAKGRGFLFAVPKYLYVHFFFVMATLLRAPQRGECIYPIHIDIQRITGYY
jgi:ribosomal protein S4